MTMLSIEQILSDLGTYNNKFPREALVVMPLGLALFVLMVFCGFTETDRASTAGRSQRSRNLFYH